MNTPEVALISYMQEQDRQHRQELAIESAEEELTCACGGNVTVKPTKRGSFIVECDRGAKQSARLSTPGRMDNFNETKTT